MFVILFVIIIATCCLSVAIASQCLVWDQEIVSSNLAAPTKRPAIAGFFVMCYTVYILHSNTCKKFYTGHTDNFANRFVEHNNGETKSIRMCVPWRLIWSLECATRSEAMILEKKIKSRGAARFLMDLGIEIA
jgi:putative endonuclease